MNFTSKVFIFLLAISLSSCVAKKKFVSLQNDNAVLNKQLQTCESDLNIYRNKLQTCEDEKARMKQQVNSTESNMQVRQEQLNDLREQLADARRIRDRQLSQVEDLTGLSQSATQNIKETLSQLEGKDKYIKLIQAARTRTDSINLALAVNLKSVLTDGVSDEDVEVKVDKTVVFVNLSDKMLFQSGSADINADANKVLGKIAKIVQDRPDLEVMVEGYTDDRSINTKCIEDNWDLSVKRATSVVRVLQKNFGVNPNRLIAAGRGEYNVLATNDTAEGRATNRRTRIIILPKLNQFYDLLNPNREAKN
ncbi:MAG: OmpA family protein [Saprospiraceae bacterium]